MDRSYFNILDSIDPRFHSFVLSKIDEIRELESVEEVNIDDFTQSDQMDVLGKYCVSLYDEFTTLRSFVLENMEVCTRSVRVRSQIR